MTDRSDPTAMKKEYYERPDVVGNYERWRFGGVSGRWIRQIEEDAVSELVAKADLPAGGIALDLPTGTGRMIPVLRRRLARVIACDISAPMLAAAARYGADEYLHSDAARINLPPGCVHLVLSCRFYPHFREVGGFLAEAARVLRPGGYLLFDAHNWSPRSLIPGSQRWLGGRVFNHSRSLIEAEAAARGFSIAATKDEFAITPFVYQYLPFPVVRIVESLGDFLPGGIKARTYYLLRKSSDSRSER